MATNLETAIGYHFQDTKLLEEAITHPSATKKRLDRGYERLEFLGDRVLGLVVAHILFDTFPSEAEGEIAKRHAALVCKQTLASVADNIGLFDSIKLMIVERDLRKASRQAISADACEALIGALYLDGGLQAAHTFIEHNWRPFVTAAKCPPQDAKSALQEWAQGRGIERPNYEISNIQGPAHKPNFEITVTVGDLPPFSATAASKKKAEQLAAEAVLAHLGEW